MLRSGDEWLAQPGEERTLLCEFDCIVNGETRTVCVADRPFTSQPDDVPANQPYDDVIIDQPIFTQKMGLFTTEGAPVSGMTLKAVPELDFLLDANVYKQFARYYIGHSTWPRDQFIPIAIAKIAGIRITAETYSMSLLQHSGVLDVEIETGVFESGPNKDKRRPFCLGTCFNVSPVLEDAATHTYRVHIGKIEAITEVRDNGVPVGYATDLEAGTFTLLSQPAGEITCDVKGAKDESTITTPADQIRYVLQQANVSDLGTINLPAWSLGIFLRDGGNVSDVVERIVSSCHGYWGFGRDGKFYAESFSFPSLDSPTTLFADDIEQGGASIKQTIEPRKSVTVNYRRNYTEQKSLAGSVSAELKTIFQETYQALRSDINPAGFPNAEELTFETDLVNDADANSLLQLLNAQYAVRRRIYQLIGKATPFSFNLGQTVTAFYPGLGLSEGKSGVVISLADDPLSERATVELWL